jgi:hypothetical protein
MDLVYLIAAAGLWTAAAALAVGCERLQQRKVTR